MATTSGYSGNFPPGWDVLRKCAQVPDPIAHALAFQHRLNEETFRNEMRRVVPVGFSDCDAGVLNTVPKVR